MGVAIVGARSATKTMAHHQVTMAAPALWEAARMANVVALIQGAAAIRITVTVTTTNCIVINYKLKLNTAAANQVAAVFFIASPKL